MACSSRRVRLCAWLAAGLSIAALQLLGPQLVAAQSDVDATRDASARTFFEEGVRLAEQGNWTDAADRFRRALSLRASPVIAYNLASALGERGKLIEASELLHRVLADENVDPELKQSASRLSSDLQQRIAHITVEVSGWQAGDSVFLDDNLLHEAQLRIEIPIDPGSHQLRVERAGSTLTRAELTLAPGERQQLSLEARSLAPKRVVGQDAAGDLGARPAAAQSSSTDSDGSVLGKWWFWTGAAAVVGAGVLVAVLAAQGGSAASERPFQGNVPPGSIKVEVMGMGR